MTAGIEHLDVPLCDYTDEHGAATTRLTVTRGTTSRTLHLCGVCIGNIGEPRVDNPAVTVTIQNIGDVS